jgi:hypothetical protein
VTAAVNLTASASSVAKGQSVSLTWSSKNAAACTASGGEPGDGWTGTLAPSGTVSITETASGTVSYSITCSGAPPAATAMTTVVVSAAGASSSGGGGAMDLVCLLCLGLATGLRTARRHGPTTTRDGNC